MHALKVLGETVLVHQCHDKLLTVVPALACNARQSINHPGHQLRLWATVMLCLALMRELRQGVHAQVLLHRRRLPARQGRLLLAHWCEGLLEAAPVCMHPVAHSACAVNGIS